MRYEKPMIINDELTEGVYAASGTTEAADCWTVDPVSVQDWNGFHHVFEVRCVHSNTVEHISSASTVVLTFNSPIKDAYSEFACTFSGNTVTVTRELLADAYKSGDAMTYKVWVQGNDEMATKGMACIRSTISCAKIVNVQGNGGDGN